MDFDADLFSIVIALGAASLYVFIFLGSFSPIHCRCKVGFAGILTVLSSCLSGFGLLFYMNLPVSTLHAWLPFLSMFLGIEHIFVLCNAVD